MRPQGSLNHKGPYSPPSPPLKTPRLSSPNHKHGIPYQNTCIPQAHNTSLKFHALHPSKHCPISTTQTPCTKSPPAQAFTHHSPKAPHLPVSRAPTKHDSLCFNPLKTSNHQSSPLPKQLPHIIHLSLTFFNITSLRCRRITLLRFTIFCIHWYNLNTRNCF